MGLFWSAQTCYLSVKFCVLNAKYGISVIHANLQLYFFCGEGELMCFVSSVMNTNHFVAVFPKPVWSMPKPLFFCLFFPRCTLRCSLNVAGHAAFFSARNFSVFLRWLWHNFSGSLSVIGTVLLVCVCRPGSMDLLQSIELHQWSRHFD